MARKPARPPRRTVWYLIGYLLAAVKYLTLIVVIVVAGGALGAYMSLRQALPDTSAIADLRPQLTTKFYSRDGELLTELYVENRELVPIEQIPRQMQLAIVAVEDSRFYEHFGADFKGIARAAYRNLRAGSVEQGGSTITEQLAKNLFFDYATRRRKEVGRRLKQMLIALDMERRYSKEEILELYLNQVCFGDGAYGVQAASRHYFGKPCSQLELHECALLAAIPRRPSFYNPFTNPEAAKRRRNHVLDRMLDAGFITFQEAEAAKRKDLGVLSERRHTLSNRMRAPYFTLQAVREAADRYGTDYIYKGGLRVYTSVDLQLQTAAEKAVQKALQRYKRRRVSQAALVCIDPATGEILAIVGGREFQYKRDEYNRAVQAHRQPGSSFKPYLYAAALAHGFTPNTVLVDEPTEFPVGRDIYRPRNYDRRYRGAITLAGALANSVNVVAVKLIDQVGPATVATYARRMGIRSPLRPHLSLALGTSEVTLLEHTSAYCAFPTGGMRSEPTTILRVTDHKGKELYHHVPQKSRVLNKRIALLVTAMLVAAVEHGTGRPARLPGIKVAGKTGTTSEGRDAWFMGFTSNLVTGVWCGNDDNKPMIRASGSGLCAPIWKEFMTAAIKKVGKPAAFPDIKIQAIKLKPDPEEETELLLDRSQGPIRMQVCTETGQRATQFCPTVKLEDFAPGEAPTALCSRHRPSDSVPPMPSANADRDAPNSGTTSPPPGNEGPVRAQRVPVFVCTVTNQLDTPQCPGRILRWYPADAVPKTRCQLHGSHSGGGLPAPGVSPRAEARASGASAIYDEPEPTR